MFVLLYVHIDGLVQDCSIFIAKALQILQFCTEPSIYNNIVKFYLSKSLAKQRCTVQS